MFLINEGQLKIHMGAMCPLIICTLFAKYELGELSIDIIPRSLIFFLKFRYFNHYKNLKGFLSGIKTGRIFTHYVYQLNCKPMHGLIQDFGKWGSG